ncbi:MAG TPA: HAD family phosphatase [Vicinamibacterales bacterium]|nr:HAD family phosphatase [Vicinamibacterales bacterium]
MPLRAIVFDFDGVLANSEPLHLRAYQDVLANEGVTLSERDYYARYLGYNDVGVFRMLSADRGRGWTPVRIERLITEKAARLEALERHHSILFPGAAQVIKRAAGAVPIAIASGALGAEIRRVLDREQLTSCFTAIVAAEDTPVSKPAPEPYRRAVELLGRESGDVLAATDCVAVEDSRWGLESARAAGLRTVGVAQTYERSALGEADLIIDRIESLDLSDLSRLCST